MDDTRKKLIEDACIDWLKRYNATCREGAQFAGDNHWLGEVFIDRCLAMNLNPLVEQVTAYPAKGRLVFIPALQTLRARARATGEYAGCQLSTYQRADKAIMVRVEVARALNGTTALFAAEGNVAQWNAQVGTGSQSMWRTNPENQCQNAMERKALYMAFPEVLQDFDVEDYQSDGQADDQPATEPPRTVTTTTDLADAARRKLAEARRTQAASAAEPPPSIPQEQPAAAEPPKAQQPQATASDPLYGEGHRAGLSAEDVEHVAWRVYGVNSLAELSEKQRGDLGGRILPKGPATKQQWEEVEFARQVFAERRSADPAAWNRVCGFSYVAKWLLQSQVAGVLSSVNAALKEAA